MATDTNQTIQDSRRAAMSFLDAAKKKAEGRKNRNAPFSRGDDTDSSVESRPRLVGPNDFTDSDIEESIRKAAKNRRAAKRAVNDFWRTAMRKGANNGTSVAQEEGESDFALTDRIRQMSDEDFEKAMSDGTITPEQLRRAGEYDWDVYMGDVWGETDLPEQFNPEPTYDEFIADPEKYGYTRGVNDELDRAFDRYKRTVKKQQ